MTTPSLVVRAARIPHYLLAGLSVVAGGLLVTISFSFPFWMAAPKVLFGLVVAADGIGDLVLAGRPVLVLDNEGFSYRPHFGLVGFRRRIRVEWADVTGFQGETYPYPLWNPTPMIIVYLHEAAAGRILSRFGATPSWLVRKRYIDARMLQVILGFIDVPIERVVKAFDDLTRHP